MMCHSNYHQINSEMASYLEMPPLGWPRPNRLGARHQADFAMQSPKQERCGGAFVESGHQEAGHCCYKRRGTPPHTLHTQHISHLTPLFTLPPSSSRSSLSPSTSLFFSLGQIRRVEESREAIKDDLAPWKDLVRIRWISSLLCSSCSTFQPCTYIHIIVAMNQSIVMLICS